MKTPKPSKPPPPPPPPQQSSLFTSAPSASTGRVDTPGSKRPKHAPPPVPVDAPSSIPVHTPRMSAQGEVDVEAVLRHANSLMTPLWTPSTTTTTSSIAVQRNSNITGTTAAVHAKSSSSLFASLTSPPVERLETNPPRIPPPSHVPPAPPRTQASSPEMQIHVAEDEVAIVSLPFVFVCVCSTFPLGLESSLHADIISNSIVGKHGRSFFFRSNPVTSSIHIRTASNGPVRCSQSPTHAGLQTDVTLLHAFKCRLVFECLERLQQWKKQCGEL